MLSRIYLLMLLMIIPIWLFSQSFTKITTDPVVATAGDYRSVNWIDYNNDGYNDLMITAGPKSGANNTLFKNNGDGSFTKITGDPIVMDGMPSDGATWADMDNDGDIDCFVVNWYGKNNLLYQNNGDGSFTQIKTQIPATDGGYSETASWGDYDNDGLVDLYVTNSEGTLKNYLYHNDGGGSFTKIVDGPLVNDQHISRSINWTDIDNDNDLDAFVSNESAQNEDLYINDGTGSFSSFSTGAILANAGNTMSSSPADYDNDGDIDIFLANDQGNNALFRNDGGLNFTKMITDTISKGIANSFGSNWGDIDNDGDLDLLVTNSFGSTKLKNYLFINNGNGSFTKDGSNIISKDLGWSYGCAFGDYDNDGFLDAAIANCYNGFQSNYLFHNNGNANHWLEIKCQGVISNRSAIGTKLRLRAIIGGKVVWQLREISAQSGYCGQNMLTAHFGLGSASLADTLIIQWPSGIVDVYNNLNSNQISLALEGASLTANKEINKSFISLNTYPNPFKENTIIEFRLREKTTVEIGLYDISGKQINFVKDSLFQPGIHSLDLKSLIGESILTTGIYFLRLKANDHILTQKLIRIE